MNAEDINPDLFPVHLDANTTRFEANGHTYYVEREAKLSLLRNRHLERYGFFSMFGRDPRGFAVEVRRAYDFNNDGKPGDVAVTLDNLMKSGADMMSREAPMLYICTLFINRADEDRRGYDTEFAKQKIEDWQIAGIETDFFLQLALRYLKYTDSQLLMLTQISLGHSLPNLDVLSQNPNLSKTSPSDS